MKLKSLLKLYEDYTFLLTDTETLLEALKDIPPDTIIASALMPTSPNLPPTKSDKLVKDRIEELKKDRIILIARVKSIKRALIRELTKDDNPTTSKKTAG